MIRDFDAIRIVLASPEDMMSWSHGEVTKAETINYRTFRPEVDGLMDEKIFGPSRDFECFCGKYKKVRYKGIVCDRCGVEVTHKRVRRERMGHIRLVSPVTHVWFSHGVPNKLALILDIPQKKLETVIYYARYVVTSVEDNGKAEAIAKISEIKDQQVAELQAELESKLAEITKESEEKTADARKQEKDEQKLGVHLERMRGDERKKQAHIKSAYNQKLENLEEKFKTLASLVEQIEVGFTLSEEEQNDIMSLGFDFYQADMGAPAVRTLLQALDLDKLIAELDDTIANTKSELKKARAIQRKKIVNGMKQANVNPEWVVLDVLPVLPPDLRPIIQLPGGRFATSDLNDLYRRVINRNNRLRRLMDLGAPQIILRNERRMLQEAVDALLDNSHRPGAPTSNSRGLPYKSLSDMLRGKQGRFRQNLLGKRVDYSGRAVIVPGPELKHYQCGLPKNIALELFKPFIVRELVARGYATNPARARMIYEEKIPVVWDILEEVSRNRPVLLNRAPTLHKQGIVAFYPILIEGNSIQLHPLMCRGFNADFDGDQMAVHLPLSKQAVEEVKERMMAPSNMLSMANGQPIMNMEKDMAMGIYFLTLMQGETEDPKHAFASVDEANSKYALGHVSLYEPVKFLLNGDMVTTTVGRIIFNSILPAGYGFVNKTLARKDVQSITADIFNRYGRDEAITVLDSMKDLGFKFARQSGFSVSMEEFEFGADPMVNEKLAEFAQREQALMNDFEEGLITREELQRLQRDLWVAIYEQIADETWNLARKKSSNLTHLNDSGATPVSSWVKNISGVRGTVTDPQGNVVDLPLMNNYKSGLNNFEYFVAARGTRKSFADVALRTADSGYLTRRLVDVAQDVVIKEEDCHTEEGIYLAKTDKRNQPFSGRVTGRFLAEDLVNPATGEVLAKKGEQVSIELAKQIEAIAEIENVKVRTPLFCKTTHGLCRHCYGNDFGTGRLVELGEAVGIIAAQSLGEPTTQLTLKNKSDARASRADVTQGLPRVEELFEVRTPKAKALVADISGEVKLIQNESDVTVRISAQKKLKKTFEVAEGDKVVAERAKMVKAGETVLVRADGTEVKAELDAKVELSDGKLYLLIDKEIESEMVTDSMTDLLVKNGEFVEVGTQLTYGSVDPKELATYVSIETAQRYIVEGVQAVYGIYGLEIDDVHLEVIVSQMARFVHITSAGDSTETLAGEFRDILDVEEENAKLAAEGKRIIQYERTLLGLTNAALKTESFLSAASFEQQVRILTDASLVGKVDRLRGLKENVIIGRPVPIGNVFKQRLSGNQEDIKFDIGNIAA
ncbi:MAG: DNA-directed RNA polymerase subunit beta' [Candidatus Doudnabacteria bacterium]|nr:DNA-directed RNA polymerase subunit beta' [Candidatus Doudnabacteria bacterium]